MKKGAIFLAALFFIFPSFSRAQNFKGTEPQIRISPADKYLNVREKLEYSVQWLGIPAGMITLAVEEIVVFKGHKCYHIAGKALPNKFFAHFYDVEYEAHSYIDTKTFRPLRFEKRRRIRNFVNDTLIDFDWEKMEATFRSEGTDLVINISPLRREIEKSNPTTKNFLKQTQDLLSSLYYFRTLDVQAEAISSLNIYYGEKNWLINIIAGKPFLRDIRKKGTFSVFKASISSIITDFILGKHRFDIYFTTDSRRIPLEFQVGTAIGFIHCRLQNIPK